MQIELQNKINLNSTDEENQVIGWRGDMKKKLLDMSEFPWLRDKYGYFIGEKGIFQADEQK